MVLLASIFGCTFPAIRFAPVARFGNFFIKLTLGRKGVLCKPQFLFFAGPVLAGGLAKPVGVVEQDAAGYMGAGCGMVSGCRATPTFVGARLSQPQCMARPEVGGVCGHSAGGTAGGVRGSIRLGLAARCG